MQYRRSCRCANFVCQPSRVKLRAEWALRVTSPGPRACLRMAARCSAQQRGDPRLWRVLFNPLSASPADRREEISQPTFHTLPLATTAGRLYVATACSAERRWWPAGARPPPRLPMVAGRRAAGALCVLSHTSPTTAWMPASPPPLPPAVPSPTPARAAVGRPLAGSGVVVVAGACGALRPQH